MADMDYRFESEMLSQLRMINNFLKLINENIEKLNRKLEENGLFTNRN